MTVKILKLNPNEIIVEERMRKELGNISELAASIEQNGQITPILVEERDGKFYLVAGERRLRACQKLGRTIEAKVVKKLDGLSAKAIELVENISRKDFTPVEKAKAIRDIHEELRKGKPRWTASDTARKLGVSVTTINDALKITAMVEIDPEIQKRAAKLTQAQLRQMARTKNRVEDAVKKAVLRVSSSNQKLVIEKGDFFTYDLPTDHFHAIFTDPPWGIDVESLGAAKVVQNVTGTAYDDKPSVDRINKQLEMFKRFYELLADDGRLITFCAIDNFSLWKAYAEEAGFERIYRVPMIWVKGIAGAQSAPQYYPSSCYEFMLLAYKRKNATLARKGRGNVFNVPKVPSNKLRHPAEKPVRLWEELLETFAYPGKPFLDPFCGVGGSLRAAYNYGMSEVWGIDINEACILLTRELFVPSKGVKK